MGLISYRVEWTDGDKECVEYFDEDREKALKHARKVSSPHGSAYVVFAKSDASRPIDLGNMPYIDQGQRLYTCGTATYFEGDFQ